uniref:G protein gamma domain-containing protein n=1 Tax=Nannospalax galili TaxID=1026970 RepID=A0A8C6RGS1_NANGA
SSGASMNALQRLLEEGMERIKVSQAAAELQQCCMHNVCKDTLLVCVPAGKPRSCALRFTLTVGKTFIEECFQAQTDE